MNNNTINIMSKVSKNLRASRELTKINDRRPTHANQIELARLAREYDQLFDAYKDLIIDNYDQILDLAHKR